MLHTWLAAEDEPSRHSRAVRSLPLRDSLCSCRARQVLSVIAQQIMTLQGAVQRAEKRVIFEDVSQYSPCSSQKIDTDLRKWSRMKSSRYDGC